MRSVRVATHCTEADVSKQHIGKARELGMDVSGFLMMSHMVEPEVLAQQAQLMEKLWRAVRLCHRLRRRARHGRRARPRCAPSATVLKPETQRGIHAHHNLSLGVANIVVAVQEGAVRVDACLAGMGAGAGNCPLEVFIAAADRKGWNHGCDCHRADGRGRRPGPPAAGPPGARRPRDAHARLCRRLLQLPAPRRDGGRHVRPRHPRRSSSSSAAAGWSAARRT